MEYRALGSGNVQGFPYPHCGPDTVLSNGYTQWRSEGEFGVQLPTPEIPKALQNRAKLNSIVKTVKNCWI